MPANFSSPPPVARGAAFSLPTEINKAHYVFRVRDQLVELSTLCRIVVIMRSLLQVNQLMELSV